MSACTRLRDGQVHTSPWLSANMVNPSSALSWKSSWAAITSEKKMLGLLLPGEGDLGDPVARRQRLAGFDAESVDDVDHPRRQQIADQRHEVEHRYRG